MHGDGAAVGAGAGADGGDGSVVEVERGEVTARLVVAADGAQSPTRKAAGLHTWGWGYGQRAVVATVQVSEVGQGFMPNTRPMTHHQLSLPYESPQPPLL